MAAVLLIEDGDVTAHEAAPGFARRGRAVDRADNGPGIALGGQDTVFQWLHRADRSRDTVGNGLGPALVRAIADLHGSTTKVLSSGPSCTVRLTAPAGARA